MQAYNAFAQLWFKTTVKQNNNSKGNKPMYRVISKNSWKHLR